MVVAIAVASQGTIPMLLVASFKRVLSGLCLGLFLWGVLLRLSDASPLLLLVISNQIGCLLSAFRIPKRQDYRGAFLGGIGIMLASVLLGLGYDVLLRLVFGAGTPTLGPWGEVRRMEILPASAILALGVSIGPAGDEWFFRDGLFRTWQEAGRPWSGALLSSGVFAAGRLDPWNWVAYFCLGLLLCAAYRWNGSVLTVWIGHVLLNAVMFIFLVFGYE